MNLDSLDEFIKKAKGSRIPRSAYVDYEGFEALYIRVGPKYILSKIHQVIDLANITAEKPGNGAFTSLLEYLERKYPEYMIHVESVLNDRFATKLLKMGFEPTNIHRCYYLPKGKK